MGHPVNCQPACQLFCILSVAEVFLDSFQNGKDTPFQVLKCRVVALFGDSLFRCVQGEEISKVPAPAAFPVVSLHRNRAPAVWTIHTDLPFLIAVVSSGFPGIAGRCKGVHGGCSLHVQ